MSTWAYLIRLALAFVIAATLAYGIAERSWRRGVPGDTGRGDPAGNQRLAAPAALDRDASGGTLLPYRVLVLGTGPRRNLSKLRLPRHPSGMQLVGFHALEKAQHTVVSRRHIIASTGPLEETVKRLGVSEIIVAVREQRGRCSPLRALLECRLKGVRVTDLARFFERVQWQGAH